MSIYKDTTNDLLRLRIIEARKSPEWYKEISSYYLPPYNRLYTEDFEELKSLYEFFNNDISAFEKQINRLCDNLVDIGSAPEDLLPYNKIRNKFEVLSGDLLRTSNDHRIVLLTAKAVKHKDEQLINALQQSVNEDLRIVLEKSLDTLTVLPENELKEFIEQQRQILTPKDINYKSYLSELEIYKSKILKHTMMEQDVIKKKIDSFKHIFIADRMFLYNGWKHGRPYIEILNPLFCGWHKSPNIPYVQNGDYFWYQDVISIAHALDDYINKLSEKDIEKLLSYSNYFNKRLSKDHIKSFVFDWTKFYATAESIEPRPFIRDYDVGLHQGESRVHPMRNDKIKRVHMEFKAYKETMFYSHTDEYNEKITLMLDKNTAIIPPHAQKVKYTNEWFEEDTKFIWTDDENRIHEVEIKWIPRRYELTRLGEDIYLDMREVPLQPDNMSAPFTNFELSYKGGIVNSTNAKSLSLMQNGLPYQLQIFAAKALQNREMSKYRGFEVHQDIDQVPEDIGIDADGNPLATEDSLLRNEILARKTGSRFFSGSRTRNNLPPPPTRPAGINVAQLGSANEFIALQNFINMLDVELGLSVGVPPTREGQITPNTNVTDNQQSLLQTSLQTQLYFFWHKKVWSHSLNEHLVNVDTYFKRWFEDNPNSKEHLLEYIAPDGARDLLRVMPNFLESSEVGLFLHDTGAEKVYMDAMLNKIYQNTLDPTTIDSLSSILKAITSGSSVEEVHRMLLAEGEKQQARLEEQNKQQQALIEQQKNAQFEAIKYSSDLKIEESVIKAKEDRETQIERAKISVHELALQKDINENNINDDIEREKLKQEAETERAKLKIKSDEKIAALKIRDSNKTKDK